MYDKKNLNYSPFHKTFINALDFGKVLWNGRYMKNVMYAI